VSGLLANLAADDIEYQIYFAGIFQISVVQIDELMSPEVECSLTIGSATGANYMGAEFTRQLGDHGSYCARRAVRYYTLSGLKVPVIKQTLPSGQA
jgi:hypothetical protein